MMVDALPPVGLGVAFLAGVLSFFSPCVAPLVPGYLSFIAGISTTSTATRGSPTELSTRRPRVVLSSLIFVLGFTLVFVLLGAGAALFGGILETYRRPLNRITGLVMIGMGLVMAEAIRFPQLQQEHRMRLDARALGPNAPLLLGMAFAFGWVPCVGPILASILLYASSTATVGTGIWLLFAYSLGLGVPFLISGIAASWTLTTARRIRRYWPWVARLSGAFLIGIGLLFVTDRFFYFSIAMQRLYYALFY